MQDSYVHRVTSQDDINHAMVTANHSPSNTLMSTIILKKLMSEYGVNGLLMLLMTSISYVLMMLDA